MDNKYRDLYVEFRCAGMSPSQAMAKVHDILFMDNMDL